ncbi:MAG: folate family ECF transporter S component [Tissierellia bacterium]|nr:folate family ECF transporter S component [Tissierellia bacterium]
MFDELKNTRTLTVMAIFMALTILTSHFFSITFIDKSFGLTFIITAVMCSVLPTKLCIIVALVSDVIGNLVFPTPGGFYPPFMITKVVTAIIYGKFLYNKKITFKNIFIVSTLNALIASMILNSLWVSQLTGNPYIAQIIARIPTTITNYVKDLVIFPLILDRLVRITRKKLVDIKAIEKPVISG